jgi:hypothetical protein
MNFLLAMRCPVGQTPWSARVPLDPLFNTETIALPAKGRPGGRPRTEGSGLL